MGLSVLKLGKFWTNRDELVGHLNITCKKASCRESQNLPGDTWEPRAQCLRCASCALRVTGIDLNPRFCHSANYFVRFSVQGDNKGIYLTGFLGGLNEIIYVKCVNKW